MFVGLLSPYYLHPVRPEIHTNQFDVVKEPQVEKLIEFGI